MRISCHFVTKDMTLVTKKSQHMMSQSLVGVIGKECIDQLKVV